MLNFGMILIFTAIATASPSPSPSSAPDPCGGAQSNLLATLNRPSIGFSPCAVKAHEAVLETGYSNAAGDAGAVPNYPQGFLRIATAVSGLEVDVMDNGRFDSGLGAKYELWHDGGSALGMDWLYTAPTGAPGYTLGGPTQTFNLDVSSQLTSKFSTASTLGLQSDYGIARSGEGGRFFSLAPSLIIADQWNSRAQAFVEAFAQTRTRPDGGAQLGEDLSFQYLLLPQLELDVETGTIANDVTRTHYVGFGFGARF